MERVQYINKSAPNRLLRLPDSWSNSNLEKLVFEERGKQGYLGKPPRSAGENRQQTPPAYGVDAGI